MSCRHEKQDSNDKENSRKIFRGAYVQSIKAAAEQLPFLRLP
jgi:hypothetical protein